MSMSGDMPKMRSDDGEFRLTGKHVLAALLGFFAMIFIANGIFLTVAVRSFPGEHVEKSYLQGLNYNDTLAEREAQAALGWRASIEEARLENGAAVIGVKFLDADAAPLSGLDLVSSLSRPASDESDQTLRFESVGRGLYRAVASDVGEGAWVLSVAAHRQHDDGDAPALEFNAKVILEE